jgi:hypothetical protein
MSVWGLYRPSIANIADYYSWYYIHRKLYTPLGKIIKKQLFLTVEHNTILTDMYVNFKNIYSFDILKNRFKKFKLKLEYKSFLKHSNFVKVISNPSSIQSLDLSINPFETNILNFNYYNNDLNLDSLDNNYESIKNFKYLYYFNDKNTYLNNINSFLPVSYATVLDYFRADFDEQA